MRDYRFWIVCLGLSLGLGCGKRKEPAPPELVRVHFTGTAHIAAGANFAGLQDFWLSPPARALEEQTLQKLARAPYEHLRPRLGGNTNDFAALIRPLLDDLFREESCLEMRGLSNATPEVALAIRLDAARAQVWNTNLATVLRSWTGLPTTEVRVGGASGWELRRPVAPNRIRVLRTGEWLIVGAGQDELPATAEMVKRVRAQGRPTAPADDYWLSAQVDWPRLAPWVKLPANIELPLTSLRAVGRRAHVRTEMALNYAGPREWKLEPWRVPTNTIHEPLVGFTALRGVRSWLRAQPFVRREYLETVPDQLYSWTLSESPFQTFLAAPMPDASNVVWRLGEQLPSRYNTNLGKHILGALRLVTNATQITLQGVPFAFPFLEAVHDPAGEFLFAGAFGNTAPSAAPAGLLAQLDRTNLLYYDWEVTRDRLPGCRALAQLLRLVSATPQLAVESAAARWLDFIGPRAGNSVTEITRTAPERLALVRTAPVGLNSIELTVLANWLEATNFPWGLDLPGVAEGAAAPPPP